MAKGTRCSQKVVVSHGIKKKKKKKSDGTEIPRVYHAYIPYREIHDFCIAENSPTPDNVARASISTPLTPYKRQQLTLR